MKIRLEILSGPLDGHIVSLEKDTYLTRLPGDLLSFPWDEELGKPQSHFIVNESGWQLDPIRSKHNTIVLRSGKKVLLPTKLQVGDIIKSCTTFLMVCEIGSW